MSTSSAPAASVTPDSAGDSEFLPLCVVVLRNFLGPYEIPWLQELQRRVAELWVVASRDKNNTLPWAVDLGGLKVVEQKRFVLVEKQRHSSGFEDPVRVHVPYGTLKHLRRIRPDAIISSELGARTLQALAYTRLFKKTKLLVFAPLSERSEAGRGAARQLLRRFLARNVRAFITLGASGARYLESLGVNRESILLVPRTTNMSPFFALPLSREGSSARRLFFSGQFIPRKGLSPFLEVLARWAAAHDGQQVEFCLLGAGPERPLLTLQARPPNLTVRFWDGVPYTELPRFYAQAGIFAFPTLADEWGVVVNEALASGVPVLGSVHSQAVAEMVKEGVNGWKFDPEVPEAMYSAIDRALSTPPDHLKKMRELARESIAQFTPDWVATRVVLALRHVCCSESAS